MPYLGIKTMTYMYALRATMWLSELAKPWALLRKTQETGMSVHTPCGQPAIANCLSSAPPVG